MRDTSQDSAEPEPLEVAEVAEVGSCRCCQFLGLGIETLAEVGPAWGPCPWLKKF